MFNKVRIVSHVGFLLKTPTKKDGGEGMLTTEIGAEREFEVRLFWTEKGQPLPTHWVKKISLPFCPTQKQRLLLRMSEEAETEFFITNDPLWLLEDYYFEVQVETHDENVSPLSLQASGWLQISR